MPSEAFSPYFCDKLCNYLSNDLEVSFEKIHRGNLAFDETKYLVVAH